MTPPPESAASSYVAVAVYLKAFTSGIMTSYVRFLTEKVRLSVFLIFTMIISYSGMKADAKFFALNRVGG